MKLALTGVLGALLLVSATAISGCAADSSSADTDVDVGLEPQGSVHFKGGKGAGPSFTDLGLALKAAGGLSGLGNGDISVDLSVVGQPLATCSNPGGGTQPPGQNPAEVTLTGTQAIPASEIKNGNVGFSLQTNAPPTIVAGAPGCPNTQWVERIEDVTFKSATIDVKQNGANVFHVTCTFSPSTANGLVPASTVTCK
jgi:hypothetical protein